jgi:hypothetical protein
MILDASSWQPPVLWLTQSSAVAKISGVRSSLRQPHALTRRINSAHPSSTGNVFLAGSGGNVVTTRETPMSRYASRDQHKPHPTSLRRPTEPPKPDECLTSLPSDPCEVREALSMISVGVPFWRLVRPEPEY